MSAPTPAQAAAVLKLCDALLKTCADANVDANTTLNALLSTYFNVARIAGALDKVPGALRATAQLAEATAATSAPSAHPLH